MGGLSSADPELTFQGHSIGRWEGIRSWSIPWAFCLSRHIAPGIEHSDELRIEERIRLSQAQLEVRNTLRDPKALVEPLTIVRTYKRQRDWDIKEYVCTQNNRDSADAEGRGDVNLER